MITGIEKWKNIAAKLKAFQNYEQLEEFLENEIRVGRSVTLGFVNQHAMNILWNDDGFYNQLIGQDILLRDGVGVELLLKKMKLDVGKNMNGTDLIPHIVSQFRGKKVALLGTEEPYLSKARDEIIETYDVEIPLCANGFYDKAEYDNMIAMKDIDMVILAMGMPKQEEVALSLKHAISKPCLIVCGGAVLDFIAGRFERAPLVLQKMRLEWFYRLCKEPARLFNRYVIGIPAFLFRLARI